MISTIKSEKFTRGDEYIIATFYNQGPGNYRYSIQQKYRRKDKSLNMRRSDFHLGNLFYTSEEKFNKIINRITKRGYKNESI